MAGSDDPTALWTGAQIKWHVTLEDAAGAFVRAELWLAAGEGERERHLHPEREERVEVLSGTLEATVDDRTELRGAGGQLTIAPGRVHQVRNAGSDVLHLMVELRRPFSADGATPDLASPTSIAVPTTQNEPGGLLP